MAATVSHASVDYSNPYPLHMHLHQPQRCPHVLGLFERSITRRGRRPSRSFAVTRVAERDSAVRDAEWRPPAVPFPQHPLHFFVVCAFGACARFIASIAGPLQWFSTGRDCSTPHSSRQRQRRQGRWAGESGDRGRCVYNYTRVRGGCIFLGATKLHY